MVVDQTLFSECAAPAQMVIVTERVFASLANVLTDFAGLPREVQRMNEDIQMSDLERKHGLLQVSTTVHFVCSTRPLVLLTF